jgi:transposase
MNPDCERGARLAGDGLYGYAEALLEPGLIVQETLRRDPHSGHFFVFRGRRGDLIKIVWHDGQGQCLFSKRLERGRFLWPAAANGSVTISAAQLGYLVTRSVAMSLNDSLSNDVKTLKTLLRARNAELAPARAEALNARRHADRTFAADHRGDAA